MNKRMYIICREDLNPLYAAIQGGHALAAHALEHPEDFSTWGNSFLIYLKKKNEQGLRKMIDKLASNGIRCSQFIEPDLGHQLTAISCYAEPKVLKNLDLLK